MNKNEWNEGLNQLDPEIVEKYVETKENLTKNNAKRRKWTRIAAIAACIAVVFGAVDFCLQPALRCGGISKAYPLRCPGLLRSGLQIAAIETLAD